MPIPQGRVKRTPSNATTHSYLWKRNIVIFQSVLVWKSQSNVTKFAVYYSWLSLFCCRSLHSAVSIRNNFDNIKRVSNLSEISALFALTNEFLQIFRNISKIFKAAMLNVDLTFVCCFSTVCWSSTTLPEYKTEVHF